MTKREDPQWGATDEIAAQAANETFFYTNAVPQMEILNRRTNAWRGLEDYILHDEARRQKGRAATAAEPGLLINVFTGPILAPTDPFFVTPVAGRKVQVPELFWKVVYYTNDGLELRRVGFLMGQHQALKQAGLVEVQMVESFEKYTLLEGLFDDYRDAEPYQSGVRFIEDRTGLVFPKAVEVHSDKKPNPLKYEAGARKKSLLLEGRSPAFTFTNLEL
jgi:endonuclease G